MSIPEKLEALVGRWQGTNRLHLPWTTPAVHESASTAEISFKANGQFLQLDYTWSHEGNPHQGVMVFGCDNDHSGAQAVWTDSWHMANKLMLCDGSVGAGGSLNVKGFYQVPDHPDWGWRTEIVPNGESFRLTMHNVSPEGDEELAVETHYSRATPPTSE